jgi:hypothetical protein
LGVVDVIDEDLKSVALLVGEHARLSVASGDINVHCRKKREMSRESWRSLCGRGAHLALPSLFGRKVEKGGDGW